MIGTENERDTWRASSDVSTYVQRETERSNAKAVEKSTTSKMEELEAKLEKLRAQKSAEEQIILGKIARAQYLDGEIKKTEKVLADASYLHGIAQDYANGDAFDLLYSGHPNPRFQHPFGALELASWVAGAKMLADAFPAWEKPRRDSLKAMQHELEQLKSELNLQ